MNKLIGLAGLTALTVTLGCASARHRPPRRPMVWSWSVATNIARCISSLMRSSRSTKPLALCRVKCFRKNWQRDYNSAHRSTSQQVKQRDIDRIKTDLGEVHNVSPMHSPKSRLTTS